MLTADDNADNMDELGFEGRESAFDMGMRESGLDDNPIATVAVPAYKPETGIDNPMMQEVLQ
jgi:hypothetical protein